MTAGVPALPGLRFSGIGKRFPGVAALAEVSFDVHGGRVHGLVGENGAGKSTLLKILSGLYPPDSGTLLLGGKESVFRSPQEAISAGIAVIHQELQLVPEMTVAENLLLGRLPQRGGFVRRGEMLRMAREQLRKMDEKIAPDLPISRLPIAHRQIVEIGKALLRNACVIAFDEPTSSLSQREIEKLFAIIRELAADRRLILYVSHRMQEIFEICDCVTVLRDGRHVATFTEMKGLSPDDLVGHMVGRDIVDLYGYRSRPLGEPVLEVEGLLGPGLSAPAGFSLARGEILGLFGLVGAGRSELLHLLAGVERARAGTVRVAGQAVRLRRPADAISRGVVLCPEDRKKAGIFPQASVVENLHLRAGRPTGPLGFIRASTERRNAEAAARRFNIRAASLAQTLAGLSGGNQQKCVLARWLSGETRVLLFDEPTRGIDVGARSEIYAIILELAEAGAGVLLVSSDLPEVLGISDRVMVMREGAIAGTLKRGEASEAAVMQLALPRGVKAGAA